MTPEEPEGGRSTLEPSTLEPSTLEPYALERMLEVAVGFPGRTISVRLQRRQIVLCSSPASRPSAMRRQQQAAVVDAASVAGVKPASVSFPTQRTQPHFTLQIEGWSREKLAQVVFDRAPQHPHR